MREALCCRCPLCRIEAELLTDFMGVESRVTEEEVEDEMQSVSKAYERLAVAGDKQKGFRTARTARKTTRWQPHTR